MKKIELKAAVSGVLTCLTLIAAPCGFAQSPQAGATLPSAGAILQHNSFLGTPAPPKGDAQPTIRDNAASGETADTGALLVHVARIVVDDVPGALKQDVEAIVAPYRDRSMSLSELRGVAVQITGVLLDHGESISRAYLPQQKVVGDVIHLAILRGHLESAKLGVNRSHVRDKVLEAYLKRGISASGDVKVMQDQLARMSDLPGLGALTPTLSPGSTPGGSSLVVTAEQAPRVVAALVGDNAGQRTTGRNRIGAQIVVNSPLGIGDQLQALGYAAPDFFQANHDSDAGRTLIGRVSYDLPVGTRGVRAGVAVSRVDYRVGGETYGDLDMDGYAMVYSVYGSVPLVSGLDRHLTIAANLDYKRMSDSYLEEDPNTRSSKNATLELSGDRRGQLAGLVNIFEFRAGASVGYLDNVPDWNGADTRGTFAKTTQAAKFTQMLAPRAGLYLQLSVDAQQASRNLDSSEKMTIGGPYAVRAFSNDTVSGDQGFVASASLHANVPGVSGLAAQLFFDYAHATVQKFVASNEDASLSLAGAGVGFDYAIGKYVTLSVSYAMRTHNELGDQPRGMTWVNGVLRF
ncbi:ShlB/FhaC/HecB family hemolysin secretion/activation protein [Burkholderia sp. 22PA0106]|uniref:ShlB/FhaC/HecB family hemolysin secretion/activation protein n=1 Tax=Burkholderia sp. 22PA0106 TaxID=3237371 RepID=UPI0039C439D2